VLFSRIRDFLRERFLEVLGWLSVWISYRMRPKRGVVRELFRLFLRDRCLLDGDRDERRGLDDGSAIEV